MKSSLLCLLATTTTVVHGDTGCAEADKSCGVCLVKGDYTPDEVYTSAENNGGTALTCKAAVNGGKFTNKAQCTGVHPDRGPTTWSAWTNAFAQKCCSSKKSACWEDIAAGVCKDKADFTPDVKTEEGKDTTCYGLASYVGMTATAQCTGTNPTGTPWASMTALVAQKCCGAKKSACWVDVAAGVCKDKADFTPDAVFSPATCDAMAAHMGLTATAQCGPDPGTKEPNTCKVKKNGANDECAKEASKVSPTACADATTSGKGGASDGANDCEFEEGEDTKGFTKITTYVAANCCGGKKSACAASEPKVDAAAAKKAADEKKAKEASDKAKADFKKSNPNATDAEVEAAGKKAFDASIAESAGAAAPSPGTLSEGAEGAGHHAGITVAVSILLAVTCFVWSM